MITVERRTGEAPPEALALAGRCAGYDREAGFTAADPAAYVLHLLVRLDDGTLVAYAGLDAAGDGALVVDPGHRSRGVATEFLETGPPPGRGWARSGHPAAERLARRFGLRVVATSEDDVCYALQNSDDLEGIASKG